MDGDFLLIQKMRHGDETAFDAFVRKYYEKILKYCYYRCSDRSFAEDLTQETFVRFFARLSDYRSMGKTINYLYTVAGNLCRDYYRKPKEALGEEQLVELQGCFMESETEKILETITLEKALKNLPEEFKEVVILYYFQGMKLKEIAKVLRIGLPLVKYRMKRAKKLLEEMLRED